MGRMGHRYRSLSSVQIHGQWIGKKISCQIRPSTSVRGELCFERSMMRPHAAERPFHISSTSAWQNRCEINFLFSSSTATSKRDERRWRVPSSAESPSEVRSSLRAVSWLSNVSSSATAFVSNHFSRLTSSSDSAERETRSLRQTSWPISAARSGDTVRSQMTLTNLVAPQQMPHTSKSKARTVL